MSDLSKWKEVFYPIEALDAAKIAEEQSSEREAIIHSLRKWRGMRHLEEYNLSFIGGCGSACVKDGGENIIYFGVDTCSLCQFHGMFCHKCSITRLAEDPGCPQDGSAYLEAINTRKFDRMIKVLEKCLYFTPPSKGPFTLWAAIYNV